MSVILLLIRHLFLDTFLFFSFKDNLKSQPPLPDNGYFLIFGFSVLQRCLTDHVHIPEIYLVVAELFLATPPSERPEAVKV